MFEKYKRLIIVGGILVVAGIAQWQFNWTAYLVPIAAFLAAAAALAVGLRRWRKRPAGPTPSMPPELPPEDAARLERDLTRYDV